MRRRLAGEPSHGRLQLMYHFVRISVVMSLSATRHRAVPKEVPS